MSLEHAVLFILGTDVLSELYTCGSHLSMDYGVYGLFYELLGHVRTFRELNLWAHPTSCVATLLRALFCESCPWAILTSYICELRVFEWDLFGSWVKDSGSFLDSGRWLLMYNNLVPSSGPKGYYKVALLRSIVSNLIASCWACR